MPAPRILTGPTIAFSQGSKETEKIDRGYIIREIAVRLSCTITTTDTAITAADILPAGLWGIVENMRLKLNSNTNIRDLSGDQLKLLNYYYYNLGDFTDESALVVAAGETVTVNSTLIIPLWMVDSMQPIDTQLDARLLSNLELQIDWGDITNITDAANVTLDACSMETGTLNAFGIEGPFNTQLVTAEQFEVTGSNSRFQIDLSTGNLYRSFLVGCQDSNGDDLVNAIDNIRIFSGGTDFFNVPAEMWQRWSAKRERTIKGLNDGSGQFVSSRRDIDAWFYVDMVTDGYLSETINAIGLSTLKIELDVNQAVASLQLIKQEIVPLAKPAKAG